MEKTAWGCLMFFLGLSFPFYCKTAKYIPRLPSPEGFRWQCGVGSTVFTGAESTQHWPSLLQRSSNPQQDLEAADGLHFSLFDQRDNLRVLESVRKQNLRRIIDHGMV